MRVLLIEDDRITDIGPTTELLSKFPNEETQDARGQYVMPGNICAHTHFYGAFARGLIRCALGSIAPVRFSTPERIGATSVVAEGAPNFAEVNRHGGDELFAGYPMYYAHTVAAKYEASMASDGW